nr:Chain B, STE-20 RELATED ADAPTOR [Homo sapiens]
NLEELEVDDWEF